ncbi:MAG: hypothetical protein J6V01_01055 [Clostridia bacterium]|nr:hypothetical protein [Clostridia bacterium]
MKLKKRLLSVVAVLLVLSMVPFSVFAEAPTEKAKLTVTAGANSGTATVYSNYDVVVTLPDGDVDMSRVTADLVMTNISDLGITGRREYSVTVRTGLTGFPDPSHYFPNLYEFDSALVNVTVDYDNPVVYEVNGGAAITASPDSAAAAEAAWKAFAGHLAASTKNDGDSYAIIANGSYIKVGTEYLRFADGFTGDLVLDDLSNTAAFKRAIRNALVLETDCENEGNVATACVKAGTTLALGSTVVTLLDDYVVEVTFGDNAFDVVTNSVLETFRGITSGTEMLAEAIYIFDSLVAAVQADGSIDVSLHEPENEEPVEEDNGKIKLTLISGNGVGGSATVYDDYTFRAVLPSGEVDMSRVTGILEMNDVAGLGISGKRSYSLTVDTGLSGLADPAEYFQTLYGFDSAVANVTVDRKYSFGYTFWGEYADLEGDAPVIEDDLYRAVGITGEPDSIGNIRAAWNALLTHVTVGSNDGDSYAVIANGSYITVGTEKLYFDSAYDGDLRLDNSSDASALNSAIREALVLDTENENQGNIVTIMLGAGTTLALGSSMATLNEDYVIELDLGEHALEAVLNCLAEFQASANRSEALISAMYLFDSFVAGVQQDGEVNIELYPLGDLAKYSASLDLTTGIVINFFIKDVRPDADLSKFTVDYTFYVTDDEGNAVEKSSGSVEGIDPEEYGKLDDNGNPLNSMKYVVAECAAKEMGDKVEIKVYYDGDLVKEVEYSVLDYCNARFDKSTDQYMIDLCEALLHYGGSAQTYFDYETDALVNSELDFSDTADLEIPGEYEVDTEGECLGLGKVKAQLNLISTTELEFNFGLKDGYQIDDFTVEIDGEAVTPDLREDGTTYYVAIPVIAKELGTAKTLTITYNPDGTSRTIEYSAITWAYRMQNKDQATADLAKAIYGYYLAAKAYFEHKA